MAFLQDVTGSALERALDATAVRQRVIANNIANIDTPGFKRSVVAFEDALESALSAGGDPDKQAGRVVSVTPLVTRVDTSLRADGNNVDIDMEAAELTENALRYDALARMVSARGKLLRTAINEGKR